MYLFLCSFLAINSNSSWYLTPLIDLESCSLYFKIKHIIYYFYILKFWENTCRHLYNKEVVLSENLLDNLLKDNKITKIDDLNKRLSSQNKGDETEVEFVTKYLRPFSNHFFNA